MCVVPAVPTVVPSAEVAAALADGRPVVALESTLIAHGLPRPDNLRVAGEVEAVVRAAGAVPATVGVIDGVPRVGLSAAELSRLAGDAEVLKLGVRDLPFAVAMGRTGATTVASTSRLASAVGVAVFATGGLGGVHRLARESWDESADLAALAVTPLTVVCAGVKSILDVPATLERMESLGVMVAGYRTSTFPGFYLSSSGFPVDWTLVSASEVASVMAARRGLSEAALVVANPLPESEQLDPELHSRVLESGLGAAQAAGVSGKDVTPFLLSYLHRETGGLSLAVNVQVILRNSRLAAEIAVAYANARSTAVAAADAPAGTSPSPS